MRGALQRQVAFGDVVRGGEQYLRTALAHILGERQQAFLLRAAGSEHQQRMRSSTSAIGPWRTSALLKASAWIAEVSLNFSAASWAMA